MFNIVAFAELLTCDAAWAYLAGVPDEIARVELDNIMVPTTNQILALRAGGEKIRRARLSTPSLRGMWPHMISPVCAEDGDDKPLPIEWRLHSPLVLVPNEKMNAEVYSAVGGATTYDYWVVALLGDGPIAPVVGDIRSMRFTLSGTITAKLWSFCTLTLAETLPVGRYQVVGADVRSGSGIAFRFVPVGALHRPGAFTHWSYATSPAFPYQRMGALGAWCEFEHDTPPGVEMLQMGTEAPTDGYVDLIKIA